MITGLVRLKQIVSGVAVATVLIAWPAIAQSNFGNATLGNGFSAAEGTLSGNTGGSVSLSSAVAERDRTGNICLGYGTSTPDHVVTLGQDFSSLTFQVSSSNADTTLIVRGPGGVRCGNDISRSNRNDVVTGTNWARGSYEVWVGTSNPGTRVNYTLTVTP